MTPTIAGVKCTELGKYIELIIMNLGITEVGEEEDY